MITLPTRRRITFALLAALALAAMPSFALADGDGGGDGGGESGEGGHGDNGGGEGRVRHGSGSGRTGGPAINPSEAGEYEHGVDHDHDAARLAVQRGEALPLADVIAAVSGELPGEIVEIEFEGEHGRWIYEIKVIDRAGRLHEIYVDAATAKIVPDRED